MLETWLETNESNFHALVNNTNINFPLYLERQEILKYLKLINSFNKFYSNMCNFDLIDYQRLIYIEENYSDDEEIINLIKTIKQRISESYIYKHKYLKRLTNKIPKEHFDNIYDGWLAKYIELDPIKYRLQRDQIEKEYKEGKNE